MRAAYLAAVLLGDLVILLVPAGDWRSAAVFAVLWVLPGLGWAHVLRGRWLIGFGLGLTVNVLLALLLHYLPGPVPFALALAAFSGAALAPAAVAVRIAPPPPRLRPSRAELVLLLLAAAFRLPSLGYSEFQGDEGVIMVRAAAALEGDDQELFLHQKGPVEILLPLASWSLGGVIDEFWARLPFAWMSILGVLAVAQLGRRWFGGLAGWVSGLVLSIEGFQVAFGRIVQYQSAVVLLSLLALLALDHYRTSRRGVDLSLGAVFLACGALAHYDAVLYVPAAGLLVAATLVRSRTSAICWRRLTTALLLGGIVLALFYIPYALGPSFAKTVSYLSQDRIGAGLHVDLDRAWTMSTVYNSSYTVILLLALLVLSPWHRAGTPITAVTWLLFLTPAVFYLIVVFDPRTHLYTLFPGAALLSGAGAAFLWGRSPRLGRRRALLIAGVGLYALCAGYTWMVFVDHSPEYQRTFPEHRSRLYWTTCDQVPAFGRFGFPHRAGWQAIGELMLQGQIAGVYASNEEQEITDWYTRQAPRTHCPGPDVYILAENVQDEVPIDVGEVERDYRLAGSVQVGGETRIRWYARDQAQDSPPVMVEAEGYRQWWRPAEVAPPTAGGTVAADVTLGHMVRLVGYDLDSSQARPGGSVWVTLYWQPLVPLARNYQVFTHLYDGEMRGQHDGAPECAINPTTRWEPGQIIPDPHEIEIFTDSPPGPVPLLVGMYDLITRDRLAVPNSVDDAILLAEIMIQDGSE
jgi:hypothetical protein